MTKARILADYVAGGTTAAEFDYMDGVTSNVQTQIDAKAPLASPTFTGNFTSVGIDDNADANAITIDSSENVGIGGTPNDVIQGEGQIVGQGGSKTPRLQITGTSDTTTGILLSRYSADVDPPVLHFVKGRGAVGSSTTAATNDFAGAISFSVEDGTETPAMGAGIISVLTDTPSNGTALLDLRFFTAGGSAPSEKFRMTTDGHLLHSGSKMGYWYEGHTSTNNTTETHTFGLSSHRIWATFTSGGNKRADVVMFNGRLNPGSWTGQGIAIGHTTPALFSGGTSVSDANNTYGVGVNGGVNQLTFYRTGGSTNWNLHVKYMHNSN